VRKIGHWLTYGRGGARPSAACRTRVQENRGDELQMKREREREREREGGGGGGGGARGVAVDGDLGS
jgi:hypothetical protein